jgi:uncharacterized protein (TIRG00374 family)
MTLDTKAPATPIVGTSRGRTLLIRMAIGLGIGTFFAVIFLQLIDFHSAWRRVRHLNIALALLCGAVFLSAYAVRALRWRLFLAPDKITAPRVIGIYFVATFLNWLLPVQGGELAKSLILRRSNGIPVSRSLATVTMDKTMDLLPAVVLLAFVPMAGLRLSGPLWLLLVFALLMLGTGAVTLAFATWQRDRTLVLLSRFLKAILPQRVSHQVEQFVVRFVDTVLALFRQPRLLLVAAAHTFVAVALDALFCYLAFRAVGVSVRFPVVLFGYTFYNLAYILPTPPAHLGSNELVGLLIFSGLFGVSRSAVGAMFLFSHPWTGFLMTASAFVCVKTTGFDLRTALRLRSRAESMGDG